MKSGYLEDFYKLLECNVDEKYLAQVGFVKSKVCRHISRKMY